VGSKGLEPNPLDDDLTAITHVMDTLVRRPDVVSNRLMTIRLGYHGCVRPRDGRVPIPHGRANRPPGYPVSVNGLQRPASA
jgi:hypothetical protein